MANRRRFRINKTGCTKMCRCPCSQDTMQWCIKRCGGYIYEGLQYNTSRMTPKSHALPDTTTPTSSIKAMNNEAYYIFIVAGTAAFILIISYICKMALCSRPWKFWMRYQRNDDRDRPNVSEKCTNAIEETSCEMYGDYTFQTSNDTEVRRSLFPIVYNSHETQTPVSSTVSSDMIGSGEVTTARLENIGNRNMLASIGQKNLVKCPENTTRKQQLGFPTNISHLESPERQVILERKVPIHSNQKSHAEESYSLGRATPECGYCSTNSQTSSVDACDSLNRSTEEWSTTVEAEDHILRSINSDSENETTLLKDHLPTPEPCEDSIEWRSDGSHEDLDTCDSDCEGSANIEDIVDRIASLPGVTFAMLVVDDKVVIGVKDEVAKPSVKEYIQRETNLHSEDYSFEVQPCSREFKLMFDCFPGDAVEVRNGKWKTGALTCFFTVKGERFALSTGHMLDDEDAKEVYIQIPNDDEPTVLGEWLAQIMRKTPKVIDALLFKITHPDVVCRNIVPGAERIKLASDIKSFVGKQVQMYGYKSGRKCGTLQSVHSTYTIEHTAKSTYLNIGDKLKGVFFVKADDDAAFFVLGECGAPLMSMPDISGTVYILGVMFGEDWDHNTENDERKNRIYYAYNLPELFKLLRESKLEDIAMRVSAGLSTEPFFNKDIDFMEAENDYDSGFQNNE